MLSDDLIRLRHMLDAANAAQGFIKNRCRDDLEKDTQLVRALVKAIEIIGEAAYQISLDTRDEVQGIPWDDIIGMRHRLVHAYFDINLDILWQSVRDDIPDIVYKLEPILDEYNHN